MRGYRKTEWETGIEARLKPCPFCGTPPVMQKCHGGGPRKRLVGCDNGECEAAPSVTGSTAATAAAKWNERAV